MPRLPGRRFRRWLTLAIAAAAAVLAAAGCSPNGSGADPGSKTITVGGVFPRTGAFAANQVGGYEAADAFFKNINAKGGIDGYTFKFIGLDSQTNTASAFADYHKLIQEDHVDILINGDDTTFPGSYTAIKSSGVPVIGCFSSVACYQNPGMYPINSYVQAAIALSAAQYYKANHVKQADLITINIPGAIASAQLDEQYLKAAGITVPLSTTFDPTTVDFTAIVARAKASGADHIILASNAATQLIPFVQTELQQGYKGQVFGPGYGQDFPRQLGAAANGMVVLSPSAPLFGAGKAGLQAAAIVKHYYPNINLLNDWAGTASWTSGEAIVQAVKDLKKAPVTPAALTSALNGFKNWQGTFNSPLTYHSGANGDPTYCTQNLTNENGAWAPLGGQRFSCWPHSQSTAPTG